MGIKSILDPVARSYFRNKYLDADAYQTGYDSGVTAGKAQGKQEEYDKFWNALQNYGTRQHYNYTFALWNVDSLAPKYKIGPGVTEANSLFYGLTTGKIESQYFDLSDSDVLNYTFSSMNNVHTIEDINLRPTTRCSYTWAYCTGLKKIAVIHVAETTLFNHAFDGDSSLEEFKIEGVIGQNGFDVHWSTKLTHESLMSIINALQDKTDVSGTWTVTMGEANLAKLSEEEIGIAEAKGWVLA